jgi:hypothetical protein
MSILLPCLMRAKESAYEIFAMETEINDEGKVFMDIRNPSKRKPYDDIFLIEINPPWNCHFYIKKPHPSGMKKIKRDRQDYIKWRPKLTDIGVHKITVVFETEKSFEKGIKIYVTCNELFEAKQKEEERERKD